jgi:membrane protease YdiL (CAAX protease family)
MAACVAISFVMDVVFRSSLFFAGIGSAPHPVGASSLGILFAELVVFVPTMCVLEEVSFRGLLDSHIQHPGDGRGWLSAAYLSALWGIWHLPIIDTRGESLAGLILLMLAAHVPFGIVMSFYWRRTGNLLVPGAAHTVLDAVRDAFYA